jgi:hypothetical protein
MYYKTGWDASKKRFNAFWNREIIDRCCLAVTSRIDSKKLYSDSYQAMTDDPLELKKYWTDPQYILERHIKEFENTFFGGEAFPSIMINLGTAGHCAYFKGCRYEFRQETIWFNPSLQNYDALEYDPQSEMLTVGLNLAKILSEEGRGKFFVGMPDNCGTLDALAHMRGIENLLVDLIENPEKALSAVRVVNDVLTDTCEQFYRILQAGNDGGSIISWMMLWTPGRTWQNQCDLSVMISEQMFQNFYLPEIRQLIGWSENTLYHFDGIDQARHLECLLELEGLQMIQWMTPAGQPSPSHYIDVLKRIQMAGKCIHIFCDPDEVEILLSNLSSRGLFLVTKTDTEEEAKSLLKQAAKWTRD